MVPYCLKSLSGLGYVGVRRGREGDDLELCWVERIEDSLSFGGKGVAMRFAKENDCHVKPLQRLVRSK